MIQAIELVGGGHELAQFTDDGEQRVRGICETDSDYWMEVLLDLLTAWEVTREEAKFEPDYAALAAEPVTSQFADSYESAEAVAVQ